nr:transposase [Clostridium sp. Marseille-P299]
MLNWARRFFPNAQVIIDRYHFVRQVTWSSKMYVKVYKKV